MICEPMDVLKNYPVRKTKKQKSTFRDAVIFYLDKLGYSVKIEKGICGVRNIVAGDPEDAEYLVTAHYDTPAQLPFPNMITPCNSIAFGLWQMAMLIMLLIIPCGVGAVIGYVCDSFNVGHYVMIGLMVIELVLMMVGPANPNNANDNTSGVVTVLDIATNIPVELRDKVCFVLFDLEEAGLFGSSSYTTAHPKVSKNQIVMNLDCVGDGAHIRLFPSAKLKKDADKMAIVNRCHGCCFDNRDFKVHTKGFSHYPSDNMMFRYGVGISALKYNGIGWLYCDKIHTAKDVTLDEKNVSALRKALIDMIAGEKGVD